MTGSAKQVPEPVDPEAVVALLGLWESARIRQLAKKVIYRLSRIKPAGLFSERNYDSIWGEYSHYVQNSEYDEVLVLLDDMTSDTCEAVAKTVPSHEMQLFDRLAEACGEVEGMSGITYLIEHLKDEVSSRASARNLERYADDYRWFENL